MIVLEAVRHHSIVAVHHICKGKVASSNLAVSFSFFCSFLFSSCARMLLCLQNVFKGTYPILP